MTTAEDVKPFLEVSHLHVSEDGSAIHLGASGLATVTGSLEALARAGFAPSWDRQVEGEYLGVAVFDVGNAVEPGAKAPYFDRRSGLRYAAGDQWVPLPERVNSPVLPSGSPKTRDVVATIKTAARRHQADRDKKSPLNPELQAEVDAGSLSWGAARKRQNRLDQEEEQEYTAKQELANLPKRYTEGTKRELGPGQVDVAYLAEQQEAGGFTGAKATHLFNLAYLGRENAFVGASGAGKSWAVMEQCRQTLFDGGTALYLDYEDAPESVVARMRALGCLKALQDERFVLVQPEVAEGKVLGLETILESWAPVGDDGGPGRFDDIILDGVSKALGAAGVDDNNASKYNQWHINNITPLVRTGACVTTVDHVGKNVNTRGGAEALGTTQKKAQANTVYAVHPITPPRPGGLGKFALYLVKDKGGDVITRTDPETGYVGTMLVDSRPEVAEAGYLLHPPTTVVSFKGWDPDKAPAPTMADLMPEVDAAVHDVFPEDLVPHTLSGKRNPKLPTLAETIWVTVAAISSTGDDARGLTEAQVVSQVQALAPEATKHVRRARILKQLGKLVDDGRLALKRSRYVPVEGSEPTSHRVPEVLAKVREYMDDRQDQQDREDALAGGEATLEDVVVTEDTPAGIE